MDEGSIVTYIVAAISAVMITWHQLTKGDKEKKQRDESTGGEGRRSDADVRADRRLTNLVAEYTQALQERVDRLEGRIDELQRALTAREQELLHERERLRDSLTLNAQFLEDPGHEPVIPESIRQDLAP